MKPFFGKLSAFVSEEHFMTALCNWNDVTQSKRVTKAVFRVAGDEVGSKLATTGHRRHR